MILYIAIIILLLLYVCLSNIEGAENVSASASTSATAPPEAIQNLSSMYNDQHLKTSKLQLGGKWLLSGVGDGEANDDWLRLKGLDGKTYNGGFAAGKFWAPEYLGGSLTIDNTKVKQNLSVGGNLDVTGNINTNMKDCKWISGPSHDKCNGTDDNFDTNWQGQICPDGYMMTGIKRTHPCNAPFWQTKFAIRCCRL
jgi:hypothetical protein